MQTIERVAASLGLSVRAVRLRRDSLDGTLDAHIKRGAKNELLFTGEALAILRRVEDLRHSASCSVRQAVDVVCGEMQGNSDSVSRQPESSSTASAAELQSMIEDIRRDRDVWRDLAMKLQDKILALPAPRPRRRWFNMLRRHVSTSP